ncbi:MAG: PAS domain S-box protein [Pseudomonadota bacterium]
MLKSNATAGEEALAFIAEQTGDVLARVDRRGILTYISPGIRLYGWTPEDLIGTDGSQLVHPDDLARFQANVAALLRGEVDPAANREHRVLKKDGAWYWAQGNPRPVYDETGAVAGFVNIFRDVTARREMEEQVRAQAELFEAAFQHGPIGKALVSLDGRFLRLNEMFCKIAGHAEADLLAGDFQTITHPEDLSSDLELLGRLVAGEIPSYRIDKRYVRADGEIVWVRLTVSMVRDAEGQPLHYVSQIEDLTDQRKTDAALSESESRYRLIADSMIDLVIRMDRRGRITWVSPSSRAYGYEPEQVVGRRVDELIHPEDLARVREARGRGAARRPEAGFEVTQQVRYRTASGEWVWLEGNPQVLRDDAGRAVGAVNVLRNVTDRRAQQELFEASFEHGAIGKAVVQMDGQFLKVNRALCSILQMSQADLLDLRAVELAHPEEAGRASENFARLAAGEIESYTVERRYRRSDGSYVWVDLTMALVRHPDGRPKHHVVEIQDLTARRAAEAALREREAQYRLIIENTSDMIIMTGLDGRTTYVSPNVRFQGATPSDLQGSSFRKRIHPDDANEVFKAFQALLPEGGSTRVRWRARAPGLDGWVWYESNATLLRDPETGAPTGFLDVIRNIQRQVEQEAEIAAAKAEAEAAAAAKSQFLANMSHEIRTPLTAVLGFTNLLRELELTDPAAGYVSRIAGAGNGLLAIVNDILDFSKLEAGKFEIRPRPTDVAQVCEETLQLFSRQAEDKGLSLSFEAEPGLPRAAMLDGDRLRQLLINLAGNAVKFTDEGGVTLSVAPAETVGRVLIRVRDSGPGLDEEAQARLFQRFEQIDGGMTRRHGGTGLGLAISRGIVEAMDGTIGVTSTPGEGATFHVELPAPVAELPAELAGDEAIVSIDGIRVFVVDDNPVNRELSRRILEAAGAEVEEAADGADAVARLALLPVDVVLMDLRMPHLDGRAALKRLRAETGPNRFVPVLAFTADADVEGDGDLDGFDGLVRKPIQPLEMYAAIAGAVAWSDEDDLGESHVAG